MKLRIKSEYPCYTRKTGCFPITVYWVQHLVPGFIFNKWVNIKGFDTRKRAEEFKKLLET